MLCCSINYFICNTQKKMKKKDACPIQMCARSRSFGAFMWMTVCVCVLYLAERTQHWFQAEWDDLVRKFLVQIDNTHRLANDIFHTNIRWDMYVCSRLFHWSIIACSVNNIVIWTHTFRRTECSVTVGGVLSDASRYNSFCNLLIFISIFWDRFCIHRK